MARKTKARSEAEEEEFQDESHHSVEQDDDLGESREIRRGTYLMQKINKGVEALLFRMSPEQFSITMEALNVKQKNDEIDMGFGALLNFKVDYLPPKLCYWLATGFNLVVGGLPNGRNILDPKHIDDVDVHLTLGLPKGRETIERRARTRDVSWIEEIANRLGKRRKYLNAHDISHPLLDEVNGDDQFKRLFLVLVEYYLIETPADGNLVPKITQLFDDLSIIRDYNWCGYVMDVLLDVHDNWIRSASRYYTGPVVFLVGCYLDMMIVGRRKIERRFPTISMWEMDAMKYRENHELDSGGFGLGHYDERIG